MQTVVETPGFLADARSLGLSEDERLTIVTGIAANPGAGKVIEGTGGARKIRFAGRGKGKSGGYRSSHSSAARMFRFSCLNVFAKNEKIDLTAQERRVLKAVLADIVKTYRSGGERR
jgi:hypothetical protein